MVHRCENVESGYCAFSTLQENAQFGQHVWFETSLSGDFCYVGELYCFAKSLVRFPQSTYAAFPLLHFLILCCSVCSVKRSIINIKEHNCDFKNKLPKLLLRLK